MTRMFMSRYGGRSGFTMHRIALNMDQVEQYDPPPNPAKLTDSRVGGYIDKFGESSWELDVLEPKVIEGLIETEINKHIDDEVWGARQEQLEDERKVLKSLAKRLRKEESGQ